MSPASAILNLITPKSQPPPACPKVATLDMTVEVETVQLVPQNGDSSKDGEVGKKDDKKEEKEEKEEEEGEEEVYDRGLYTGLAVGDAIKTVGLIGAGAFAKRKGQVASPRVAAKTGADKV